MNSFANANPAHINNNNNLPDLSPYPGLGQLHAECCRVYPGQPNPLQMKTRNKYWQHGPDPLDYISIYSHPGNAELEIPPHWHYVSFGLSDIYGDGRVHAVKAPPNAGPSGFGFELTFRLRKDSVEPPLWPGSLLQKLATYVFQSANPFMAGDHISWHQSLSGDDSRIHHMLCASDPELREVDGPFGSTKFVQIVGVTIEELEAVQHWNGPSFIELLRQNSTCGGRYLITDVRRGESLFEADPSIQEQVTTGIANDGSNLSGVTALVSWDDDIYSLLANNSHLFGSRNPNNGAADLMNQLKDDTMKSTRRPETTPVRSAYRSSSSEFSGCVNVPEDIHASAYARQNDKDIVASFGDYPYFNNLPSEELERDNPYAGAAGIASQMQDLSMSLESASSCPPNVSTELQDGLKFHDTIHIKLNLEAALLIPLALQGRIRHGRHFSFKSASNGAAVTITTPDMPGCITDAMHKYASKGNWLQVWMDELLVDKLLDEFEDLKKTETVTFPKVVFCPESRFALTITL